MPLRNPMTGGYHWYHGSAADFDSFRGARGVHDYDPRSPWNTLLGDHFSAHHETAQEFGMGLHQQVPDPDAEEPPGPENGHLYHAHLHVSKPIYFDSEGDFEGHIKHVLREHIASGGDSGEHSRDVYLGWMKKHGHDSVVYGNECEGPHKHPSIIVPDKKHIEVVGKHSVWDESDADEHKPTGPRWGKYATWIGDHIPEEPSLYWRAPNMRWEVHIKNHMPDRNFRENYGAKPKQEVWLHEYDTSNPHAKPAKAELRDGQLHQVSFGFSSKPPPHVMKHVMRAQQHVDENAANHEDLYGQMAEQDDIRSDLDRVPRDMADEEKGHQMFRRLIERADDDDEGHTAARTNNVFHVEPGESEQLHKNLPNQRLFAPTKTELDPSLFDGDHLKPLVRHTLIELYAHQWDHTHPSWRRWTKIFFTGSQASYWWGNHDFDTLIGVKYDVARRLDPKLAGLSDTEIDDVLNAELRHGFNNEDWIAPWSTSQTDYWHLTGYVNTASWDIARLKPYAAYDVIADQWVVHPDKVPSNWSVKSFGEGFVQRAERVISEIKRIEAQPNQHLRAMEGQALWDYIHGDRSRAFSEHGTGWKDWANALEKYLDQTGWLTRLLQLKHAGNVEFGAVNLLDRKDSYDPAKDNALGTTAAAKQFFHGTDRELRPGDVVQPWHSLSSEVQEGGGNNLAAPNFAFATSHLPTAQAYGKNVYRVEPVDESDVIARDHHNADGGVSTQYGSRAGWRVVEQAPSRPNPMDRFTSSTTAARLPLGSQQGQPHTASLDEDFVPAYSVTNNPWSAHEAGKGKPRKDPQRVSPEGGSGGSAAGEGARAGQGQDASVEAPETRIALTDAAEDDLSSLAPHIRKKTERVMGWLDDRQPTQTEKLKGQLQGYYSTRVDKAYRIIHSHPGVDPVVIHLIGNHNYNDAKRRLGARWNEHEDCPACSGTGEQGTGHECYKCDGTGSLDAYDDSIDNANPENGLLVGRDDAKGIKPVEGAVRNLTQSIGDDSGPPEGIMVHIVPPMKHIEPLLPEDGEHPDSVHMTLAYLGKMGDHSEEQLRALPELIQAWAEGQQPMDGHIVGLGAFVNNDNPNENERHVLWANADVPGLVQAYVHLHDYLRENGYKPYNNHGFTPHITLGYYKHHVRFLPKLEEKKPWPVREVWLAIGPRWESFPLGVQ